MPIFRRSLTEQHARTAMAEGEFAAEVRNSRECVAIVLTQDWCPQWTAMRQWFSENGGAGEPEIDVWELEYNREPYGGEFMHFKERELGNDLIPYVRYYRNGVLVGESNYVSRDQFISRFS